MKSTINTENETIYRITVKSFKDLAKQLEDLQIELSDLKSVSFYPSVNFSDFVYRPPFANDNYSKGFLDHTFEFKLKRKKASQQEIENAKNLLLKEGFAVSAIPQPSFGSSNFTYPFAAINPIPSSFFTSLSSSSLPPISTLQISSMDLSSLSKKY